MLQPAISVIIPAFNEEKTISSVISSTLSVMDNFGMPYEIIVVDDGSNDGTFLNASRLKATVLSNQTNHGKGYSLRRGFQAAQGEIIVTIDSDGAHDPKEIPDLVRPLLNGSDAVSGSRFMGSGKNFTTRINRIGNFMMNTSIMILTGKRITDSQSGFRAFKTNFLKSLNLEACGFEIEAEITVKGLKNGFRVDEIPIGCQSRRYNVSKVKILRDGIRIFRTILRAGNAKISH